MVRAVVGLFIGALQLFVTLNACIRSVAGKWLLGSIGGVTRTFLLMAITMASARMRIAGAEPSPAFSVALYAGPVISVLVLLLALRRRRKMPAGSEAETAADKSVKGWMGVVVIDGALLAIGVGARLLGVSR
jgi:hypothetical protein